MSNKTDLQKNNVILGDTPNGLIGGVSRVESALENAGVEVDKAGTYATFRELESAIEQGVVKMTIDTEMSDTSENPVQNKVIKKYVDDNAGGGAEIIEMEYNDLYQPVSAEILAKIKENPSSIVFRYKASGIEWRDYYFRSLWSGMYRYATLPSFGTPTMYLFDVKEDDCSIVNVNSHSFLEDKLTSTGAGNLVKTASYGNVTTLYKGAKGKVLTCTDDDVEWQTPTVDIPETIKSSKQYLSTINPDIIYQYVTFKGVVYNMYSGGIWTDGFDIYYSQQGVQKKLDIATKTWNDIEWNVYGGGTGAVTPQYKIAPNYIWTDGQRTYFTWWDGNSTYAKDIGQDTFTLTTKYTFPSKNISYIGKHSWTDGEDLYFDNWATSQHYKLDKSTNTWVENSWNIDSVIQGQDIWTDGVNVFCSISSNDAYTHYKLDKENKTFNQVTFSGFNDFVGRYIWTDGTNVYMIHSDLYLVDGTNLTLTLIRQNTGINSAENIWTDGTNIYCWTGGSESQYMLTIPKLKSLKPLVGEKYGAFETGGGSSEDAASLTEENTFTGKNNFNAETEHNAIAEHNADINVNDSTVNVTNSTSDTVTKYGEDIKVTEGESTYAITIPKKTGTIALTIDVQNIANTTTQIVDSNNNFYAGGSIKMDDDSYSVTIGDEAKSNGVGNVTIGPHAQNQLNAASATTVGPYASTTATDTVTAGHNARTTAEEAIQLGTGTNNIAKSLQILTDNIYKVATKTLTVENAQIGGNDTYGVLKGTSAPSVTTEGKIGQEYQDTTNGKRYFCSSTDSGVYIWQEIQNKLTQSGTTVADDVNTIVIGNLVMQSKTFSMTGNTEQVFSFPTTYTKLLAAWCNSTADGLSANNSAAVTSSSTDNMTVRICGADSTVTMFSIGYKNA